VALNHRIQRQPAPNQPRRRGIRERVTRTLTPQRRATEPVVTRSTLPRQRMAAQGGRATPPTRTPRRLIRSTIRPPLSRLNIKEAPAALLIRRPPRGTRRRPKRTAPLLRIRSQHRRPIRTTRAIGEGAQTLHADAGSRCRPAFGARRRQPARPPALSANLGDSSPGLTRGVTGLRVGGRRIRGERDGVSKRPGFSTREC
jgi:hypothetical protein